MMIASEDGDREGEAVANCVGEDLSHSFEVVLKDLPNVLSYIKRLNEHIKKQQNVLSKLYEKLKEYKTQCASQHESKPSVSEVATQTESSDFHGVPESASAPNKHNEWSGGLFSGNNLAEEVRKVAENAMQQTGFVYEETSGMYYDYNTGYYYNAELGLYYDGHHGTYMYYNEATKCYEYHSQASLPASNQVPQQNCLVESPSVSLPSIASCTTGKSIINDDQPDEKCKTILQGERKSKRKSIDSSSFKSDGSIEEGECSDSSTNLDDMASNNKREVDVEIADIRPEQKKKTSKRKHSEDCLNTVDSHVPESDVASPLPDRKSIKVIQSRRLSDEASAAWPPCMRIIVQNTDVKTLNVGTLFIVTCKGGTLGREKFHAVCIPDINISKHHGKFSFDEKEGGKYFLIDYGSRNGTYVNKKRLSAAKQESEPHEITHGTIVTLGSTELLCHIHPGRETCEECEPGVVAAKLEDHDSINPAALQRENKSEMRKQELKRLRKRFGLESGESKGDLLGAGYEDRAEIRRVTVGSQNEHAKTETASVSESIKSSNKGFEMLSKMGWKQGDSLGKDGTGLVEPVLVTQRAEKAGLGADNAFIPNSVAVSDPRAKRKADIWVRAQHRYEQINSCAEEGSP